MPREIQTRSLTAKAVVTATASAYSSGQIIGTLLTLNAVGSTSALGTAQTGVVCNLALADYTKANAAIDVVLFHSLPAGTFTDKTTFDPSTADLKLIAAVISIAAADYDSFNANSVATKGPLAVEIQNINSNGGDAHLYALLVSRDTPNPGAGAAWQLSAGLLQD